MIMRREMASREREKKVVKVMVEIYCRRHEGNRELCGSCRELLDYAFARIDSCAMGNRKTTCRKCPVHCYKPLMRERIRSVMRFSGPRMILFHPVMALRHLISEMS